MNSYPVDERGIWEVEQGRTCEVVVPWPTTGSIAAGDSVIFALAHSIPGESPCFVKNGDSVRVMLTGVSDTGENDRVTGRSLVRLTWNPLGR